VACKIESNQRTFLLLFLRHVDGNVDALFLAAAAAAAAAAVSSTQS